MSAGYYHKNKNISKPQISHPKNCTSECPYGRDKAFCFPCYKNLMEGIKRNRKD